MEESEINFLKSNIEFKEVKKYTSFYAMIFVIILMVFSIYFLYTLDSKQQLKGEQICEERGYNYSGTILQDKSFAVECYDEQGKIQIKKEKKPQI